MRQIDNQLQEAMTMHMQPRHMMNAPRDNTPAEDERAWLDGLRIRGRALLDELVKGYPQGGDVHIEAAVSDLESACDSIWRRQCALEEAEG